MRGSIVRREDRFSVVTDIPPGPEGKRRQKWHAGYPTRQEAEQQLRRVLCELDAGRWVEPSDRTVGAYLLEDWPRATAGIDARPRGAEAHLAAAAARSHRRSGFLSSCVRAKVVIS